MQPGQPDMQMILQQAQKMQEQLMAAQAELAEAEVVGQAGNGLVQVTMHALPARCALCGSTRRSSTLTTSRPCRTSSSARCRTPRGKAQQLQAEKMGPLAGGLGDAGGLGLPGLG